MTTATNGMGTSTLSPRQTGSSIRQAPPAFRGLGVTPEQTKTGVDAESSPASGVLRLADELFRQQISWTDFISTIYGEGGTVERYFPKDSDRVNFEATEEGKQVRVLLAGLRDKQTRQKVNETTRVITIRIPDSMHKQLKRDAADNNTSMNKLATQRLLLLNP